MAGVLKEHCDHPKAESEGDQFQMLLSGDDALIQPKGKQISHQWGE
jgi:hypothetical protein